MWKGRATSLTTINCPAQYILDEGYLYYGQEGQNDCSKAHHWLAMMIGPHDCI